MKVLKLDCNTLEILDFYKSLSEASRVVGCIPACIREACVWTHRGRRAKGFRWFAMDERTGLNHYDIRKNEKGENLSLEEVKEIIKYISNNK